MGRKLIRLQEGDYVKIILSFDDISVVPGMRMYDGVKATVTRAKKCSSDVPKKNYYIYELAGVKSKLGVPYTFTRDMLKVVGEEI